MQSTPPPLDEPQDVINVWIVEDHENFREGIQEMLDYEPGVICSYAFPTCEHMLEVLGSVPAPDIILMDISMPVMNGYEATAAIREQETDLNRRPAQILALTAHVLDEERQACLAAGMNSFLTKPLRKQDLMDAIGDAREALLDAAA